jgi:hypothetical protein
MSKADLFAAHLEAQLGEPYVLGDEGPHTHDCSGLHYEGMRAAGVLWKGRPWPRETANDYKMKARPTTWEALGVGDPIFFCGTSGHAHHVASYVGGGYTIEARGRRWGVVKYHLDDPSNGVKKRGGRPYHYPGIDLGELEDDMTPEQDKMLRECKYSTVKHSFELQILAAKQVGDTAQVAALEAKKTRECAALRAALKL